MVQYNFKKITVVPTSKDFVDIVLSRTQRQTPTVVHKHYAISRIRQFYMRKVKFTQQTYHEKLTQIIEDFPRLDDIHPFYGDLLNVLYDKDHYKLALGQINTARNLIDRIAKDYVRLLKFGDTLYRCKQLKRAAMGRMCTLMKKQGPSLAYLEQVRQHMSRLPSIDPQTRTILVCGYPNVGKSSFVNKITRADVDVQPYAFTTKSLFVGHTDYKYLRWQVIDTPGILDHPLEDRNTIEMLAITALAHLRAAVLFVVDLSGSCGYSIAQQAALFHSIKPLFANKPLMIACNKTDLQPLETLPEEEKALIEEMRREAAGRDMGEGAGDEGALMVMSTMNDEGVVDVKNTACERLLQQRVEVKMKGKKMNDVVNRIYVAEPRARDHKERPPVIPQAVLEARANEPAKPARKLERELQEEQGGAGVYSAKLQKHYMLADEAWKDDVMPEIMDGKNIADFIDPDIMARLEELERLEEGEDDGGEEEMEEEDLTAEEKEALQAIRRRKRQLLDRHRARKTTADNRSMVPRKFDQNRELTTGRMEEHLSHMGIDPSAAVARVRERSVSRQGRKRGRSEGPSMDEDGMQIDGSQGPAHKKMRDRSRSRSAVIAVPGDGFKDSAQKIKIQKIKRKGEMARNRMAKQGEADRVIPNKMPKHLFSGKRGIGKTDRR
ncbi:Nucleolar GTP-binding protein [Klebsormidium nitens]|uniref:Nucleolar GTP-binding protein 1 n=1 Tax=Klebsormidium nitens TaxID=105231 RepID=A0A1Y1I3U4_KLENI|nr:Nucleolar GTP-binding protein [Klebsormidium nitens]|eukprot:GAQ85610.1 Nucleolar GTP-binding protein [Klebsormidium nitens]